MVAGVALAVISVQFRSREEQSADGHNSVTAALIAGAVQPSQNILPDRDLSDRLKPTSANPQTNALLEPIEAFRRWVEAGDRTDPAAGLFTLRDPFSAPHAALQSVDAEVAHGKHRVC